MAFRLKGCALLTFILGCGKLPSLGTQKIWTFTALTTCTMELLSPGMLYLQSMVRGLKGWLRVSIDDTFINFAVVVK